MKFLLLFFSCKSNNILNFLTFSSANSFKTVKKAICTKYHKCK